MASFLIPVSSYPFHSPSLSLPQPPFVRIGRLIPLQALTLSPPPRLSDSLFHLHRKTRSSTTVTRAGASTSGYVFAFVLPLSLLAITVFASIQIADKLDRDFLEELAVNEALREAYESDEDVEGDAVNAVIDEEPALARTRNRPKRQAETSSVDQ